MKGIFIPEITVEMFRNACLESIEELMAEGEVYDIEYDPKSVQPQRMVLPEICILEGYDTVEDENGNKGFGVYIPSEKQIYVTGDVPQEIMLKALFHELTHWVQDISGRHFDEDEANLLAERVYEALPHDMRGDSDDN